MMELAYYVFVSFGIVAMIGCFIYLWKGADYFDPNKFD